MEKGYVIYSKPDCPWCVRAKILLEENGERYTEKVLGKDYTRDELAAKLGNPERLTVPQIFFDDQYVGNYEVLKESLQYHYE